MNENMSRKVTAATLAATFIVAAAALAVAIAAFVSTRTAGDSRTYDDAQVNDLHSRVVALEAREPGAAISSGARSEIQLWADVEARIKSVVDEAVLEVQEEFLASQDDVFLELEYMLYGVNDQIDDAVWELRNEMEDYINQELEARYPDPYMEPYIGMEELIGLLMGWFGIVDTEDWDDETPSFPAPTVTPSP